MGCSANDAQRGEVHDPFMPRVHAHQRSGRVADHILVQGGGARTATQPVVVAHAQLQRVRVLDITPRRRCQALHGVREHVETLWTASHRGLLLMRIIRITVNA